MAPNTGSAAQLVSIFLLAWLKLVSGAVVVQTKTIVNVGGRGVYDEVYSMSCGGSRPTCLKRPKVVGGCLAPFDEEQTLKLRGPMEVSKIGVYYPSGGGPWNRVSFYDRQGIMDNIVFMGDYGRAPDGQTVDEEACWTEGGDWKFIINGDDFMCHGYNQSYVSRDGKCARRAPELFSGFLDDHIQVNVLQASKCGNGDCGFFRGQGHHGWSGANDGAKLFALKVRFPEGRAYNAPALWLLHASIVRTANHHPQLCNCRGIGSPGGCGELDIAEVVEEQGRKQDLDTTVYSFKGAFSDQSAYTFERPTHRESVFVTIFNPEGYVQVLQLDDFKFGGSIPSSEVRDWNNKRELIIKLPGQEMAECGGPVCTYAPAATGAGFAARLEDGVSCVESGATAQYNPSVGPYGRPLANTYAMPHYPGQAMIGASQSEPTPMNQNNVHLAEKSPEQGGQMQRKAAENSYKEGYITVQLNMGNNDANGFQQYQWPPSQPLSNAGHQSSNQTMLTIMTQDEQQQQQQQQTWMSDQQQNSHGGTQDPNTNAVFRTNYFLSPARRLLSINAEVPCEGFLSGLRNKFHDICHSLLGLGS